MNDTYRSTMNVAQTYEIVFSGQTIVYLLHTEPILDDDFNADLSIQDNQTGTWHHSRGQFNQFLAVLLK